MKNKNDYEYIINLYKKIINNNKCARYMKVDLHVHTPSSSDYDKVEKENTLDEEMTLFLEKIAISDIDIIAITDHNTIDGYKKYKEIVNGNEDLNYKLRKKLILPGIEITCYNIHFLAIFDENIEIGKIERLLYEVGLKDENIKNSELSADRVSPLSLCEKINEFGGITILPHVDSDNGLLQYYIKDNNKKENDTVIKGNVIKKILNTKNVLGVCVNNKNYIERIKDVIINFNKDMKILQASDCHSIKDIYNASGKPLGERCSYIKVGKLKFTALKNSIKNVESKVFFEDIEKEKFPYIIGVAVKNGKFLKGNNDSEWFICKLSSELNCLVGPRGTGKSTIIDIIKYIFNPEYADKDNNIINRFDEGIVFINNNDEVLALCSIPLGFNRPNLRCFSIIDGKLKSKFIIKSKTNKEYLKNFKKLTSYRPKVYIQKDLFNAASEPKGILLKINEIGSILYKEEYIECRNSYITSKTRIRNLINEMCIERRKDFKAEYTNEQFEKEYKNYYDNYNKYIEFNISIIKSLNEVLDEKLNILYEKKLNKKTIDCIIDNIKYNTININKKSYDVQLQNNKLILKALSYIKDVPNIIYLMFTYNYNEIIKKTKFSELEAKKVCENTWRYFDEQDVLVLPEFIVEFELNVNNETNFKPVFKMRNELSYGQKAVGMLLIVIYGLTELGDITPLIIDQPEDDLDNSYVYNTLVKEFENIKRKRQLVIATHNPNIPIAGNSENIIALNGDGVNGWLKCYGTVDNEDVRNEVLSVLEGNKEAFTKRIEIYGL